MHLHSHSSDRYDVQVNECVTTHARPQVNIITSTFLVLTSFLCSTGTAAERSTAALRRHTAFSVSTPSPLHLFRCFPILSESVLLPPTSNTFLCMHSTRTMDSAMNQSTYTCRDSNLLGRDIYYYTYQIWQAVIYAVYLSVT